MTTTNEQCGDYLHNMNGDDVKTWQLGRLRNERSNDERRPSFLRFLCLRKDERRLPSGGPRHLVPGRSPRPRAVAGRTSGSVRSIRTRSGTRHLMIRIIKKKEWTILFIFQNIQRYESKNDCHHHLFQLKTTNDVRMYKYCPVGEVVVMC